MNLKIADYFGIPLYFNILIFPFLYVIYLTREDDLGIFAVALFVLMLFFVLLHEYGHCFMARKLGWSVDSVTLLPIGGIAKIQFGHNPKHEIAVALAGPAVSLALSLFCFGGIIAGILLENSNLAFVFIVLFVNNTVILLFNLLPLFPSDGGRVLRAILSMMLGHLRGTWWAVRIGQTFAVMLSLVAICFGYLVTGFLLLFLIVIAQNELAFAKLLDACWRMRNELAVDLDKPELRQADLPEIIAAVDAVEATDLKEKINKNELVLLLRNLEQSNIRL